MQQRLLVKFSCDLYNDILLRDLLFVFLLDFVSSGCHSTKFIYLYFYYLIANILSKEKCCKLFYLLSTCTIISSMTNTIIDRRFYFKFNILLLLILFYSYY